MKVDYSKKVEKMMAAVLVGNCVILGASAVLMEGEDMAGIGGEGEGEMAEDALKAMRLNDVEVQFNIGMNLNWHKIENFILFWDSA